MAKTTLDIVGKDYRSIGLTHPCPVCGSKNTYFSCSECNWVCYECGEVFETLVSMQAPSVGHTWLLQKRLQKKDVAVESITEEFSSLRDRLRRG